MRKAAHIVSIFLSEAKAAYAETISNYASAAIRTTRARVGLAVAILIIAMSTGFRIIGAAWTEEQPLTRVLSVWGAALWLFGFGYSAAIILRPVLQRTRR
jgi:hypothetical protein